MPMIAFRWPVFYDGPSMRISLTLIALILSVAPTRAEEFSGKVVGVSDGDTIRVMREGKAELVRLWGIDCPESRQPFGMRAKQFTGELAFGLKVRIEVRDTDRYGRTVAEVFLPDGKNLNHELVRAGLAWWYRQYAKSDQVLARLESEARVVRRGLWNDDGPVPPWEWRKTGATTR